MNIPSYFSVFAVFSALAVAFAEPLAPRQVCKANCVPTPSDAYFWVCTEDAPGFNCVNGPGGIFSATWNNTQAGFVGKGWQIGARRTIQYAGTYNSTGWAWLGVYGWTINPLVQYNVIEAFSGTSNPAENAQLVGSPITVDGSIYNLYQNTRVNQPSIVGSQNFRQYWAIRSRPRSSGTVNMTTFFEAWASAGLPLGSFNYQVVAIDAYTGSGSAIVSINEVSRPTSSPTPTSAANVRIPDSYPAARWSDEN